MKLKPISEIKLDLGINPGGRVQKFFADTCAKHMDRYVPKDVGDLRDTVVLNGEVTENVKADGITYTQEYAHAQYIGEVHGKPIQHWSEAGTGPYWDRQMVTAEMQDVIKEVQEYVNKYGNR